MVWGRSLLAPLGDWTQYCPPPLLSISASSPISCVIISTTRRSRLARYWCTWSLCGVYAVRSHSSIYAVRSHSMLWGRTLCCEVALSLVSSRYLRSTTTRHSRLVYLGLQFCYTHDLLGIYLGLQFPIVFFYVCSSFCDACLIDDERREPLTLVTHTRHSRSSLTLVTHARLSLVLSAVVLEGWRN